MQYIDFFRRYTRVQWLSCLSSKRSNSEPPLIRHFPYERVYCLSKFSIIKIVSVCVSVYNCVDCMMWYVVITALCGDQLKPCSGPSLARVSSVELRPRRGELPSHELERGERREVSLSFASTSPNLGLSHLTLTLHIPTEVHWNPPVFYLDIILDIKLFQSASISFDEPFWFWCQSEFYSK